MQYIQKLFTSRDNGAEADSYVGQTGRIWWDPITNSFYYSDGVTPGGFPIGAGGGANPGGANTQVQFNNNSTFGGVPSFTYNDSTHTAAVTNFTSTGNVNFSTTSNVSLGTVANLHITGGSPNYVLSTDGSGNLSWSATGGGSTPPAGSNTQVQFNNAGSFGSSANLSFNSANNTLNVAGSLVTNNIQMGDGLAKFCHMSVFSATTISTTPYQSLWQVPAAEVAAVDFVILSTNLTDNSRQTSKITSMILGTTIVFNEYSGLQINGGVGTFYVEYVPGATPMLVLSVTPDSSTLTTYDTMITQYRAI